MRQPRRYIVRVYRHGYRSLVGVVEDLDTAAKGHFPTVEELWALLRGYVGRRLRPGGSQKSNQSKPE